MGSTRSALDKPLRRRKRRISLRPASGDVQYRFAHATSFSLMAVGASPNNWYGPRLRRRGGADYDASKGGSMPFRPGQLHYFVTVAQEGQITRAARKLHIAQPALSQAIAQLETDLGLKLLERHARGVTLTEAGEKFLEKARVAVAADRDALQTAQSLARAQTGVIEFGFLGTPPGPCRPRCRRPARSLESSARSRSASAAMSTGALGARRTWTSPKCPAAIGCCV